ncbi:MAG TPA: glycosyltransferase family 39 protein [Verrucomicrobiae bacterium]|nr:glycosyltransferase family 39 protein [Verrucomicrobiae bacterium]
MPTQTQSSSIEVPHSAQSSRHPFFIALIVVVWAAVYGGSLFQPPLMDDADTVHAEAAREMVERGDWVTLKINDGFRYLEKAPLIYWLVAASYKIFGVHDWSTRLPIALGMLALLLVVYRIGRRFYAEEGGLYAALALGTGFGPFIYTRFMIPEMLVALWLALGFDFFLTSLEQTSGEQSERGEQPSLWVCWGLAATMALNVLTKGLIGLVFPIGTIFFYLLLTKNLRHLLRLRLLSSFLVFLAIAMPWHLLAGLRNPAQGEARGFFWFYFVNEHFLRFLKKRYPADYDTVPLWLFWGLMLVWLMPWTAFIVQAVRQVPAKLAAFRGGLSPQQRGTLVFALWPLLILLFFSFSSRQEYYVLPGLPGVALLLGGWLARESAAANESSERRSGRISSMVLAVIGIAVCIACVMLSWEAQAPPRNYDIAELLKQNPEDYALSFGHILDLTPQAMGAFKIPLLVTGFAFLLGTTFNFLLRRVNRTFAANMALTLMTMVLLYATHQGLVIFSPVLSSKVLAEKIEANWKPGAIIEDNGDYEAASSVNFYTRHQIRILNGRCNNIWYGSKFPDAPPIFDDDASFEKLWHSSQTVFLITGAKANPWAQAREECPKKELLPPYVMLQGACLLAKWGGKLVLTNERKTCPGLAWPQGKSMGSSHGTIPKEGTFATIDSAARRMSAGKVGRQAGAYE